MHNLHAIDLRNKKPLAALYAAAMLRTFALSFINIFLPLYLLQTGYSLENILVFYLISFLTAGLASILAARSLAESGLRLTVGASSVFLLIMYLLLLYGDAHQIPIYALALFAGLGEAFYIIPMNVEFSITADKKHESEEVGLFYEIPFIVTILGPVIGGALVFLSGFNAMFLWAALLMFASIIPLFWAKEMKRRHVFRMPDKVNTSEMLGVISAGAREVGAFVFWPIFLFLLVKQFVAVGIVISVAHFSAALAAIFIGNMSDRYGERRMLEWGSLANALSWPLRVMFVLLNELILVAIYIGISAIALLVPMQSVIYKIAKKQPVQYFIFEQFMRALGRVAMILAVLALAANLYFGLILCSLAALGCSLYTKGK